MVENTSHTSTASGLRLVDFTWEHGDVIDQVQFVPGFNLLGDGSQTDRTLVLRLMRYAMGGSHSRIDKSVAESTKQVRLRFLANGKTIVTRRAFTHPDGQFDIDIEGTLRSLYPREAASLFLETLAIPRVHYQRGDSKTILSFNDIARTFVVDRDISYAKILAEMFAEERRLSVQLMMGLTTQEIADTEEDLSDVVAEINKLTEQIKGIELMLSEFKIGTSEQLERKTVELQSLISELQRKEDLIRASIRESAAVPVPEGHRVSEYERLRSKLIEKRNRVGEVEKEMSVLVREVEAKNDLKELLVNEVSKLERNATSQYVLSSFTFSKCPRCLRAINASMRDRERESRCMLCDRDFDSVEPNQEAWSKALGETKSAAKEADTLLALYKARIDSLGKERLREQARVDHLQSQIANETAKYVSPMIEELSLIGQERARFLSQMSELNQENRQRLYANRMQEVELPRLREKLEELQLQLHQLQFERNKKGSRSDAFLTHFQSFMKASASQHFQRAAWDTAESLPLINEQDHTKALTGYDLAICVLAFHYSLLAMKVKPPSFETPHPGLLVIDEPEQQKMRPNQFQAIMNRLVDLATNHKDQTQIIVAATNQTGFEAFLRPITSVEK